MKSPSKYSYKKLLVLCVASLIVFIYLVFVAKETAIPLWKPFYNPPNGIEDDYVKFLDVGQGDSILISSNGYNALIDFGNQYDDGEALVRKLKTNGVRELHCVVASHFDSDHIGGGAHVLQRIKVHNAVMPEFSEQGSSIEENLYYSIKGNKVNLYTAKPGMAIHIGEFELTVIGYYADENDSNDSSLIIMANINGIKFLFTGDAGEDVEERLIDDSVLLDCDVYKVGHHGSRNSNSEEFIKAASPKYAVISVGEDNQYGHPHKEVLNILKEENVEIFRTDHSGDIVFRVDDNKIYVNTEN